MGGTVMGVDMAVVSRVTIDSLMPLCERPTPVGCGERRLPR